MSLCSSVTVPSLYPPFAKISGGPRRKPSQVGGSLRFFPKITIYFFLIYEIAYQLIRKLIVENDSFLLKIFFKMETGSV